MIDIDLVATAEDGTEIRVKITVDERSDTLADDIAAACRTIAQRLRELAEEQAE